MNYLNDYAIDALAMRAVNAYLKAPSAQKERILPDVLCNEVLGLKLENVGLSQDGSIIGMTSYGDATATIIDEEGDWSLYPLDGKTVLVEKQLLENPCGIGRYNFTVVHEAAHQIFGNLGCKDIKAVKNRLIICRSKKATQLEFEEWQTDRLTAAILMNKPMLFAAMKETGIEGGIDILNCMVNNGCWSAFCHTAKILGVSLSALEIRMNRLGLIRRDLRNPEEKRSILDIC